MGAFFQEFVNKFIWDTKKSSNMTINGSFWSLGDDSDDTPITESVADKITTVWSCKNVRGRTVSALPINTMRERGGKKEVVDQHPVYWLLGHEPNNYMTSANLFMTSMIHSDSWGNSYILINRDYQGTPISLEILPPWEVTPKKVNGNAFYVYDGQSIPSRDMLHFRWFSYDGLCGVSPIRANAEMLKLARKEDRYTYKTMGIQPPGYLSYDGTQTPTQRAENQKSWEKDVTSGRIPLLTGNWKYSSTMLPAGDTDIIANKKITKLDILAMFQMPPAFVQDYERQTFSNAEQSDLIYAKHTITPIVRTIEQECNMKLFTEREKATHFVKFNMNGLLRGDTASRAAFYTAMRNIGGLNGNEIRSYEDLNQYEGGDIYTVQGGLVPVDQLRDFYTNKVAPTAPQPKNHVNGYAVN